jgi:hypothetical protein
VEHRMELPMRRWKNEQKKNSVGKGTFLVPMPSIFPI